MSYNDPILWQDDVRDPANTFTVVDNGDNTKTIERAGELIQPGTPQSAANFNAMQNIAFEALMIATMLVQEARQHQRSIEALNEEFVGQALTVEMTNSLVYPFNNSKKTVSIETRDDTDYRVEVEVQGATGNVGDIYITDKTVNTFKIQYTGSATSVTVKCFVTGGAKLYG